MFRTLKYKDSDETKQNSVEELVIRERDWYFCVAIKTWI